MTIGVFRFSWSRGVGPVLAMLLSLMFAQTATAQYAPPGVHSRAELLFLLDYMGLYPGPAPGATEAEVEADLATIAAELQIIDIPANGFPALRSFAQRYVRLDAAAIREYAAFYRDVGAGAALQNDWEALKSATASFAESQSNEALLYEFEVRAAGTDYGQLARMLAGHSDPKAGEPDADEEAYWSLIQDLAATGNPAIIAAYLDRYPNGAFKGEALATLNDAAEGAILARPTESAADRPEQPPPPKSPAEIEQALALSASDWRSYQSALGDLGYAPGIADGQPGGRTRRAIIAWQRDAVFEPTGWLTAEQIARLKLDHGALLASRDRDDDLRIGEVFSDCAACPSMMVLPGGAFTMGSPDDEGGRNAQESPQRRVSVPAAFAMGVYPVTFTDWDACVADGGCDGYRPDDAGWGRGDRPVINVGWRDLASYFAWLSAKTGKAYRLPSEAEWEYAARAGTRTRFHFGDEIDGRAANFGDAAGQTLPVNDHRPNAFGLYDIHGNAWEWTQDCWLEDYAGAPSTTVARESPNCGRRVVRGGSWKNPERLVRSASRGFAGVGNGGRNNQIGFRVARDISR